MRSGIVASSYASMVVITKVGRLQTRTFASCIQNVLIID